MDPSLYHVDYERLVEVLISIVVFSFLIERALSVLFESRLFIDRISSTDDEGNVIKKKGVKEVVALIVCIAFAYGWDFDAITIITQSGDASTIGGIIITGGVIAGGSKASIGLFKDLLGFMSSAEKERKAAAQRGTS
jgi:hypothetical protein